MPGRWSWHDRPVRGPGPVIFEETPLAGAFIIRPEPIEDERGSFARLWCRRDFAERGLPPEFVQANVSRTAACGTLRGLHFQTAPHEEDKLVRCTRGAIYDVIVDLRPTSPTFTRHLAKVLTPVNGSMMFVPKGFAHGFLSLDDDTEVSYLMSAFHAPEHARGVRWDDPAFGIRWPMPVRVISERDAAYPDFWGVP